ncbi:hypothetical protein YC2023_076289 [Brassica napus]|uniref:(rape) hypothetical protein n=1 Tax=Brassica napus TaxID=3708 RepID=A0A816Q2V2_BRANA|nr:unnamed protein product [Brassica napus]
MILPCDQNKNKKRYDFYQTPETTVNYHKVDTSRIFCPISPHINLGKVLECRFWNERFGMFI